MIQLYRERDYWQIWERDDAVVIHRGIVGQRGATTELCPQPPESKTDVVRREATLAAQQGFAPVAADGRAKLLVHYRFHDWPAGEVASFAEVLKGMLGDVLGWTGNGVYDGFSVGTQEITLWFLVIDHDLAVEAVIGTLGSHGYLQDAETQASIAVDRGGNVVFAYPPERRGERFM